MRKETLEAHEQATAAGEPPPPTMPDARAKQFLALDMHNVCAEVNGPGSASNEDVALDFGKFRSLLARHAVALQGGGDKGGKKGKKKK